tara:strand:- start:397 stop:1002 length:606 start_codon:yes stop_codon:yes gene_type:complete
MMALSTIGANQIASLPASSVGSSQLASGAITSAAMPTGSVLQIQRTQYTSTTSTAVNTQTNVSLDHLAVNITPISTSSIIKIDAMVNGEWSTYQSASYNSVWFFYRDSTKLSTPASSGRAVGIHMGTGITIESANAGSTPEHAFYSYFDTPSTTSQITYKVGVYQGTGSNITWWTNRTVSDVDGYQYERGTSFISVTEIAG